jgi:hypothetical protein
MKVCSVCNEIVSSSQGCSRIDCPVRTEEGAGPTPKTEPGFTGRADKAVQAGLAGVDTQARRGTRQVLLAIAAVAFLGGAGSFIFSSAHNPAGTWGYGAIDLKRFGAAPERSPSRALDKKEPKPLPAGYKPIPKEGWYAGMGLKPPKFRPREE